MKLTALFLTLFLTLVSCQNRSDLKLPSLIGDNMLLQQKTNAKIWGKANPGSKISVSASWNANGKSVAGTDGKWSVALATPAAGGPFTITSASIPEVRLFNVQRKISGDPIDECAGKWEVSTPENVKQFSATAYFFGKKLHDDLHVPVGLIESAWGGTPSESWTSSESLTNAGEFVEQLKSIKTSEPLQAEYQVWL